MATFEYIIWLVLSTIIGFVIGFIGIRVYEKVNDKILLKNAEKIAEGGGKNTFILDGKPTQVQNFRIPKEKYIKKEKVIEDIPNKTKKGGKK